MRVRVSLLLRVRLHPYPAVQIPQAGEVIAGHDVLTPPNHHPNLHLLFLDWHRFS